MKRALLLAPVIVAIGLYAGASAQGPTTVSFGPCRALPQPNAGAICTEDAGGLHSVITVQNGGASFPPSVSYH